jgi:hypothetical protein
MRLVHTSFAQRYFPLANDPDKRFFVFPACFFSYLAPYPVLSEI